MSALLFNVQYYSVTTSNVAQQAKMHVFKISTIIFVTLPVVSRMFCDAFLKISEPER